MRPPTRCSNSSTSRMRMCLFPRSQTLHSICSRSSIVRSSISTGAASGFRNDEKTAGPCGPEATRSFGALGSLVSVASPASFSTFTAKESLDLGTELVGTRDAPPGLESGFEALNVLLDLRPLLHDAIELLSLRRRVVRKRTQLQHHIEVAAQPLQERQHGRGVRCGDVMGRLREESDRWDTVIAQVHLDHGNGRSGDAQETFGPLIIGTKQLRPR